MREEKLSEANDNIRVLKAAREAAVKARCEIAGSIVGPYNRGQTEEMRENFVKLQTLIEALDRAIISPT